MDDQIMARLLEASFPALVAGYVLVRLERGLSELSTAVRDLCADVRELRADIRAELRAELRDQRGHE